MSKKLKLGKVVSSYIIDQIHSFWCEFSLDYQKNSPWHQKSVKVVARKNSNCCNVVNTPLTKALILA